MKGITRLAQGAAILATSCALGALRITTVDRAGWGLPGGAPVIIGITALVLMAACAMFVLSPRGETPLPLIAGRYTDAIVLILVLLMGVTGAWRDLAAAAPGQPPFTLLPIGWPLSAGILALLAVRILRAHRAGRRRVATR